MQRFARVRDVGRGIGVVLACLGAVALPGQARADDASPAQNPPVPELAETVLSAVEHVGLDEPDVPEAAASELADALEPPILDDVSTEVPKRAAEEAAVEAVAESSVAQATSQEPATADTTHDSADTTADIPRLAADSPPTDAPASPRAAPANVNVSVRIGSPGAGGAIAQTNIVTSPAESNARSDAPVRSPAVGPAVAAATGTKASTQASIGAGAAATLSEPSGTWTWSWDCVSTPSSIPVSRDGSASGITPLTWLWNWNCPDNEKQYHDETSAKYRPINVNISIRLSSPGDDGPVTQINVVGATFAPLAPAPVHVVSVALSPPIVDPPSLVPPPQIVPLLPTIELPTIEALVPTPELVPEQSEVVDPDDIEVSPHEFPLPANGLVSPLDRARGRPLGDLRPIVDRPQATIVDSRPAEEPSTVFVPHPSGLALIDARASGDSGTRSLGPPARRPTKKTKNLPRWRLLDPQTAPHTSSPGVPSAAPAGAGGAAGGGLPIILALPFIAALLDLARRVVLERMTWPSGHSSRMPDRPG